MWVDETGSPFSDPYFLKSQGHGHLCFSLNQTNTLKVVD